MEYTESLLNLIRAQPENEVEWTLHNISNAVLVEIIMGLLKLLNIYQMKMAEYEESKGGEL